MQEDEAKCKATGKKLPIFVYLGDYPNAAFVQIEDDFPVAELRNRIKGVWGKALEGVDVGTLVVRTKEAADKFHLLDDAELELAKALKCDFEGKFRVYVEVPKVEAAGTASTKEWHKDIQELKGEFSQLVRALVTGVAAKGVSTQAEFFRSISLAAFHAPPPKKLKVEEEGKYQFKAPLPPESPEKAVQAWMNEWIERVKTNPSLRSVPMDGHNQVTFSNRKPDVPCHAFKTPKSESNIVIIGDMKKRRADVKKEDFTDEEKGHIFDFLQELLQTQPFRESVNGIAFADGFLCDSHLIQFFRLIRRRTNDAFTWDGEQSHVMHVQDEGGNVLLAMLESPPDQRGWNVPKVKISGRQIGILQLLGSGATGNVFRGSLGKDPIVVKVFHSGSETAFATEVGALKTLDKCLGKLPRKCHVATLLGEADPLEDGRKVLLLNPEGKPFACSATEQQCAAAGGEGPLLTSSAHFCLLVDVLQFLHTYPKLGHRDVKLSNFFAFDGDSILLNDFGSSAPLGARTYFCGALQNAPLECVDAWKSNSLYEVKASDDLEMVVRAIFQRVSPQIYAVIQGSRDGDYLIRFWRKYTSGQPWQNMLQAASLCDYNQLKKLISELALP